MNDHEKTAAQLRDEISALRQRNAELEALAAIHQEAEARFRLLAENSTDFISRHTPEGVYLYASPACRKLLGYEPEELIGHPAYEFIHSDDFPAVMASHRAILTQQAAYTISYRIRRKDGAYTWFETTSHVLYHEQTGAMVEIQAASRDISERKHIENKLFLYRTHLEETIAERTAELAKERNLLRILIDNMPDLILIKDRESRFLAVNQALAHLMGAASPNELLGKTDFDFYPHDYAQHYYQMEQEFMAAGQPSVNDEELHTDPDTGEPRWFLATKIPFRDQGGVIRGLVGISRDITERKRIEEELNRYRNHLEELVKERTEEIQHLNARLEERVKQRTAELQAANEELQSFAYIVSHDLKAPLRAISRLTHWLVSDYGEAFDDRGREMAELLLGRARRMDDLIEGILAYSRIGRIVGQKESVHLDTLLPAIIDWLAPPPTIRIEVAPNLPTLVGDKTRFQQVFANLIGNAVKFMDKPQGEIMIQCRDAGDCWRFSVADNGPGIDPKYHDKIFQIFQTLHPRDEVESTGIGLAIVKKILESHGGRIWVESKIGAGSTFYFTWPKFVVSQTSQV